MKLIVFSIWFYGLFVFGVASAFLIENQQLTPVGESQSRAIPFLVVDDRLSIMLPVRSLYTGFLVNQSDSIAAIDYHETSDYDGFDLVVSTGRKIFILPDIWNSIEQKTKDNGILPRLQWDVLRLTVKSISANQLKCRFQGILSKIDAITTKEFFITVHVLKNNLDLKVSSSL